MKAHGIARIGRDVELRSTSSGESVATLALAFTIRQGREEVTQWVDAALWGKRAEALAPYLLKGAQIGVDLEGVHIQTYEGKNGVGHKLVGRVVDITLVGKRDQAEAPRQAAPAPQRQAPRPAPQAAGSGFDDMDDDIPF